MGIAREPVLVKLFIAITFNKKASYNKIIDILKIKFGEIDFYYGPIAFNFTNYYEDEMGKELQKAYMTFVKKIKREELSEIKVYTNHLEQQNSENQKRIINIDPGYLASDKLVLASTKDFYHRIYIGNGIFAEVTLHYRKGHWRYFSWTYPDYKTNEFFTFLDKTRADYMKQIRMRENKEG